MSDLKEGFYHLHNESEETPVLVHGYKCTDLDGAFVFGFNAHDGGGLLPLSDLSPLTDVRPVTITEA
jgi:hypothetical protein